MRISDWSSDVCSSDLAIEREVHSVGSEQCRRPIIHFHRLQYGKQPLALKPFLTHRAVKHSAEQFGVAGIPDRQPRYRLLVAPVRTGITTVRKRVGEGKSGSVRGERGGGRVNNKKHKHN